MRRQVYEQVIETINENFKGDFESCYLKLIKESFVEENPKTLRAILSQQCVRNVTKLSSTFKKGEQRRRLYRQYEKHLCGGKNSTSNNCPDAIVKVARDNLYSSAITSKIVLGEALKKRGDQSTDYSELQQELKRLGKNPDLIEEGHLAHRVFVASIDDDSYGFLAEGIKAAIGDEHELRVKIALNRLGVSFEDEYCSRLRGYDKTPDFRLCVPFAVGSNIVNWIESKALFGDDVNHKSYLNDQLYSYYNRFGPGMVIYWFGFIEDLASIKNTEGILISEKFPNKEDIVFFKP